MTLTYHFHELDVKWNLPNNTKPYKQTLRRCLNTVPVTVEWRNYDVVTRYLKKIRF